MSDNTQLLIDAAKAAGYDVELYYYGLDLHGKRSGAFGDAPTPWNPATRDADAFRLMVDCGIHVRFYGATIVCENMEGQYLADEVDATGNQHAATRMAIVRAAAQSQENKK